MGMSPIALHAISFLYCCSLVVSTSRLPSRSFFTALRSGVILVRERYMRNGLTLRKLSSPSRLITRKALNIGLVLKTSRLLVFLNFLFLGCVELSGGHGGSSMAAIACLGRSFFEFH